MAAVTEVTRRSERGATFDVVTAEVDIAATGDTYATGLTSIRGVMTNKPASITAMAFSGGTITFTVGGAVAGLKICVLGK